MPGPLIVNEPSSFAKTTNVGIASNAMTRMTNKICRLVLFILNTPFRKTFGFSTRYTPMEVRWFPPLFSWCNNLVDRATISGYADSGSFREHIEFPVFILSDAKKLTHSGLVARYFYLNSCDFPCAYS